MLWHLDCQHSRAEMVLPYAPKLDLVLAFATPVKVPMHGPL